jgi:manganese oxidase
MRRHRSTPRLFASYSFLLALLLLTASPAAAQTPAGAADRPKVSPAEPAASQAEATEAPAATEPVQPAPDPVEAKAEPAKAEPAKAEPAPAGPPTPAPQAPCQRNIKADVVALAQPIMLNRLGAAIPGGLIFALKGDTTTANGQIRLLPDKRPRPLVLRANVGDCLTVNFTNAIPRENFAITATPTPTPAAARFNTSEVSLHVQGMEWVKGSQDDGSFVGVNNSSLASAPAPPSPTPSPMPPSTQTYTLFAKEEGTWLLYTMGDTMSVGNQLTRGLFGAMNVQPAGAEWYRSQVSADDLQLATYNAKRLGANTLNCPTPNNCVLTIRGTPARQVKVVQTPGGYLNTPDNHPLIDYNAVYPAGHPRAGKPILKMLDSNLNIAYGDLTAIITGPNAGRFSGTTGPNRPEPPCNSNGGPTTGRAPDPLFCQNPAAPDRKQPYREITVIYHGGLGGLSGTAVQAFPVLESSSPMGETTTAGQDAFAINYGTGGIGAEIYANRIGVGPMGDCIDCKFEEFFLSAWPVGDPAMLVDRPANTAVTQPVTPFTSAGAPVPPPPPLCTDAQLNSFDPSCTGQKTPATGLPYAMKPLVKASRAYYPDDPSNVYHSYINDHVKFRILHGGRDVTHVHHQHAHQWLQSPNSDTASYLDSQMISPGASYTLEMVYNGSGNRNKVVGDSIFHCHFYPHFAAGMWAMWRTHDVFESGTYVYPQGSKDSAGRDISGQVVAGSRALPDGEIPTGVPNPAVVPVPTLPMAPLPSYAQIQNNVKVNGAQVAVGGQIVLGGVCKGNKINGLDVVGGCTDGQTVNGTVINSQFDGKQMTGQFQPSPRNQLQNPGFPFFIPGIAGARAPHPPLDFAPDGNGGFLDGGLPRHVVTGGRVKLELHTKTDWSKDFATLNAVQLPEEGTAAELAAMAFFGQRCYPTFFPDGTAGSCPSSASTPPQSTLLQPPTGFVLNGLPRKNASGNAAEKLGAQPGAPFADPAVDDNGLPVGNKRVYKAAAIQLDVTFNKKGWHYPQQRMLALWQDVSPTYAYKFGGTTGRQPEPLFFRGNSGDVIEYWHTNLVPNYYEQDAFQVRTPTDILGQHIHLVKFDVTSSDGAGNGWNYEDGTFAPEEVQEIHHALTAPGGSWTPCAGCTSTLRAPQPPPADICSVTPAPADCTNGNWLGAQTTIQRWYLDPLVDNSNFDRTMRTVFTHDHFGPSTHQQAGLYAGLLIEPQGSKWTSNDGTQTFGSRADGGPTSWQARILTTNPADSYREFMLEFQDLQLAYMPADLGGKAINPPSTPSLVTTGIPVTPAGTQSVNYTNDPLGYRVGQFGDLSYAYDNSLKLAPTLPPNGDPYTPLMRAYQGDNVQIRTLVGAHVFAHQFNLEGPTWFSEPSWKNSGYRSAQAMGLSEHFELLFRVPSSSAPSTGRKCPDNMSTANCADYLYSPSIDPSGLANGLWGLFRAYDPTATAQGVMPLPNNPVGSSTNVTYATCPATLAPPARKRVFNITAVTAEKALVNQSPFPKQIVYNDRGDPSKTLTNTLGVMYVRTEDLDSNGALKPGVAVEPLILRANAGDCIQVNLTNAIATNSAVLSQPFRWAAPFNQIATQPNMSGRVGLHPQLLSYDGAASNGINVGWNTQGQKDQTVAFGQTIAYQWYAGKIERNASGALVYTPVEFGTANLFPSDPLFQHINGLYGSVIIEPAGSTWQCGDKGNLRDCDASPAGPPTTRAAATVTKADGKTFREFAVMLADDVRILPAASDGTPYSSVNYRTEPWPYRYTGNLTNDFSCYMSNQLIQQAQKEPVTPIFRADVGDAVRFRMAHPFGTGTSQVFTIHGHNWQRNPYTNDSTQLGDNQLSQWLGSRDNYGSTDHADLLIDKAGGEAGRAGDYLYTVFVPNQARQGPWGIFRVGSAGTRVTPNAACPPVTQPGYVPRAPNDDSIRFLRPPLNSKP